MGGDCNEHSLLASCYRNSLNLAKAYNCNNFAFPIISSGAYGFPQEQALQIVITEIQTFLDENDMLASFQDMSKVTDAGNIAKDGIYAFLNQASRQQSWWTAKTPIPTSSMPCSTTWTRMHC